MGPLCSCSTTYSEPGLKPEGRMLARPFEVVARLAVERDLGTPHVSLGADAEAVGQFTDHDDQ